jgi:hypothetical protein
MAELLESMIRFVADRTEAFYTVHAQGFQCRPSGIARRNGLVRRALIAGGVQDTNG